VKSTYEIGDLVVLKSGGPVMTVEETFEIRPGKEEQVRCQWFSGKKLESGVFPVASLKAPPESQQK
jgi:uncharacterized protein YodC (DUF2158 family)